MTISKLTITAVLGAALVSGCVAPDVVSTNKINDENLTCADIGVQMGQLESIRAESKKGKTLSGANVAAAVFFWPAVIGNNMNANKALEAANEREAVLAQLAKKKRCTFKTVG